MTQLDEPILNLINHAGESPLADLIFVAFTVLGFLAVTLLVGPILWAGGRKEHAFDLVVCVVVASVLVELIKLTVMRDRPFVALGDVVHAVSYYGLSEASGPSFPSGHAARAFTAAVIVSSGSRLGTRIGAFGIASMVALSRVYLGLHWPSDVVAGALLGILVALLILRLGAIWRPYMALRRRIVDRLARARVLRERAACILPRSSEKTIV